MLLGYPLVKWLLFSRGAAISKVQWSRSKPGVFFSLDKESYFYIWYVYPSFVDTFLSIIRLSNIDYSQLTRLQAIQYQYVCDYDFV